MSRAEAVVLRLAAFIAVMGAFGRLIVLLRRAESDAADWQEIARNYRWKIDQHGKDWCVARKAHRRCGLHPMEEIDHDC